MVQGADAVNVEFRGLCFCFGICGDQGVTEVEQPAFMQRVWEVTGLMPEPWHRHWGILIRFGAFPKTPRTFFGVPGGR